MVPDRRSKPTPGPYKKYRTGARSIERAPWKPDPEHARQDREASALRADGGVPVGCVLHDWPGPREDCPGCLNDIENS